ncbi:hypothetical protein GCM10022628_09570 [Anoxybacillus suryakundensis]
MRFFIPLIPITVSIVIKKLCQYTLLYDTVTVDDNHMEGFIYVKTASSSHEDEHHAVD